MAALGKPRSPGINILLFVVTLGVYWFVWMWKAFGEVERYKGGNLRRPEFIVPLIALHVLVLAFVTIQVAGDVAEALAEVEQRPASDSPLRDLFAPKYESTDFIRMGVSAVFYLVQMWYLIGTTKLVNAAQPPGWPQISTGFVVGFNVSYILSNIPFLGLLFSIAALVLSIVWIVQIQQAMNRLWSVPVAPPPMMVAGMPPPVPPMR